jgi:hypothetical protein
MNHTRVRGSHINLDELKEVKNVKELKATDIFSHLDKAAQNDAYNELWEVLKPQSKKETSPPSIEDANPADGGDAVNKE